MQIRHFIPHLKFETYDDLGNKWYNPIKPEFALELRWVRAHMHFSNQHIVVDAGCHYGYYSLAFHPAFVYAIDESGKAISIAKRNFALNNLHDVTFIVQHINAEGVPHFIKPPDVYKMDIEGGEFICLENEVKRFPDVYMWIIEIHPPYGDCELLTYVFRRRYQLWVVDREQMRVHHATRGEDFQKHLTIIATRR